MLSYFPLYRASYAAAPPPAQYAATGYAPTYSTGYAAPAGYSNSLGYNTGYAPVAAGGYSAAPLSNPYAGLGLSLGYGVPSSYAVPASYGVPAYGSGSYGASSYGLPASSAYLQPAVLSPSYAAAPTGYGLSGYGAGLGYGLSAGYSVPSYGLPQAGYPLPYPPPTGYPSLIYAAASTTNEVVVKPDETTSCSTPAETCPVCENFVSLDVMSKSCSFSNVFAASISGTGSCKQMTVNKNMKGKMSSEKVNFALKPGCTCPELTGDNSEVLVFLPKESQVNNGQLAMDNKVYIVKKSQSTAFDATTLIQSCNKSH